MIAIWIFVGVLAAVVVFLLLYCAALSVRLQALSAYQKHHDDTLKDVSEYIQENVKVIGHIKDCMVELNKHTPYLLALEEAMKQEENGKVQI